LKIVLQVALVSVRSVLSCYSCYLLWHFSACFQSNRN